MGYYTELKLNVILKEDSPITNIIDNLCNGELIDDLYIDKFGRVPIILSVYDTPNLPIEHIFGKSARWDQIFHNAKFNTITNNLIIDCDIKAYDNIYEQLIDWLSPYIVSGTIKKRGEDNNDFIEIYNK